MLDEEKAELIEKEGQILQLKENSQYLLESKERYINLLEKLVADKDAKIQRQKEKIKSQKETINTQNVEINTQKEEIAKARSELSNMAMEKIKLQKEVAAAKSKQQQEEQAPSLFMGLVHSFGWSSWAMQSTSVSNDGLAQQPQQSTDYTSHLAFPSGQQSSATKSVSLPQSHQSPEQTTLRKRYMA
eukprot:Colp12_sorted_trinity150504_noHs@17788